MSKVRFYELRTKGLAKLERQINKALASEGKGNSAIRLFQTADGRIGYSLRVVPSAGGRKDLNIVHRVVCRVLGYKRGRPPGNRRAKSLIPKVR